MPAPAPVTIVLADDHVVVRAGLRLLLDAEAGFEVVAEAGDVDATLRAVLGYKPSVLVLDVNMPGSEPSSLERIPDVLERSPGTGIVVLTMQEDPEFARLALRTGALAYVLKESADGELVEAVHRAAAGERYVTPRLGALLAAAPRTDERPGDLTARELEVLRLIALGHTNAEIGAQIFVSVRTVESHRARIQQKLGRSTRAELVRFALDHGVLDDA